MPCSFDYSIGSACARDLAQHGVALALTYSKGKESIDKLIAELEPVAEGRKISSHQVDIGSREDIERLFKEIESAHGQTPDILVSNAGHGVRIPDILDIPIEEFEYTIKVNLNASFILTKLAVPRMIEQQWGRLIYMSSIAATGTSVNGCHYSASKGGLDGMARNLAAKLAKHGITSNTVQPAMIGGTSMIPNADMLKGTPGDVKNIPVGRLGTTPECANVVTMLCRTGYMTGQTILLSGGLK